MKIFLWDIFGDLRNDFFIYDGLYPKAGMRLETCILTGKKKY
jgi:hypothetical protein